MKERDWKKYEEKKFQVYGGEKLFKSAKAANQKIRDTEKSLNKFRQKLETTNDPKEREKILKKIADKEFFLSKVKPQKLKKEIDEERKIELFMFGLLAYCSLKKWEKNTEEWDCFPVLSRDGKCKMLTELMIEIKVGLDEPGYFIYSKGFFFIDSLNNFTLEFKEKEIILHRQYAEKVKKFLEILKRKSRDKESLFLFILTFMKGERHVNKEERKALLNMIRPLLKTNQTNLKIFRKKLDSLLKEKKY